MIAKFRIWDKEYKKYWKGGKGVTIGELASTYREIALSACYDKDSKFDISQQFTGLKDRNNKEIFKGDIVEYNLGQHSFREVVVWNHQGYRLETFDKNSCIPLAQGLEYNIIGNVFENPELLK